MTEIEAEHEMSRTEVADYLREFASQLDRTQSGYDSDPHQREDDDGRVTFMVGSDSATIDPPERVTFEVEVDSDSSLIGGGEEYEVEFELSWEVESSDEAGSAGGLEIQ